jgi:HAD superfamily hydrolase (TIGR01549 family)
MISAIILDFDGVILESVSVKTEAFRELFSSETAHLDEIVQFHTKNGGMSRFDKIRYIYSHILHKELTDTQFHSLCTRFANLVLEKVLRTPFVPGAREFLQNNYTRFPLYVVSATPEDELREIIGQRGLSEFFQGVNGAPVTKIEHIEMILTINGYKKETTIFIGDAMNDFRAAQECGIKFIGRILPGEGDPFAGNTAVEHTISNLFELDPLLTEEGQM